MKLSLISSASLVLLLAACGGSASVTPASSVAAPASSAASTSAASSTIGSASSAASTGAAASGSAPASAKPSASAAPASGSAAASAPASGVASASASGSATASGAASGSAAPAASAAIPAPIAALTPLSPPVKMRLYGAPVTFLLPVFVAVDNGYFAKAGLDVDFQMAQGSSNVVLPSLAKGDIDVLPVPPTPPLFNQAAQGFNIKAVSAFGPDVPGRIASDSLMVVASKANEIKDYKDLKGRTIDASNEGSALALMSIMAIRNAGLTPGTDVKVQYNAKTGADMLALAKSGSVDVLAMPEPFATQAAQQGLVVRFKTLGEVAPWFTTAATLVSASFLQQNPQAVEKMLEVLILTGRDINKTNGDWTPAELASIQKWMKLTPDIIQAQGKVPQFDPNMMITADGLTKTQDLWLEFGLVKQKIDVNQLLDLGPLNLALQKVGKA